MTSNEDDDGDESPDGENDSRKRPDVKTQVALGEAPDERSDDNDE